MTPGGVIGNYKVNNSDIRVYIIQNINSIIIECPVKYKHCTTMLGNFHLKINKVIIDTIFIMGILKL